ncbi:PREDICTED: MIT domain-containing protein 1-like isoform X1 [Rhagoletis zephyria]|uniref:MIT domain-containing protein 1-like isoform X1 n=1 Tax=Rhagoletis zephyria TaxID=28612 RepID=UPI00081120F5|nr:PREDICTED: MIT domain-containing protein 1-like isoform X1 [Rhagoletis zephyria]XP_017466626.1 PREDICTED: MIT domain-containing protein 1-like isoform X1 [Rhagoletis zephyria]
MAVDKMSAKDILMRAVECDQVGRILEAQDLYEEGQRLVMQLVAHQRDESKKKILCERIKEYNDRMRQIKERVQKHVIGGELVSSIPIDEDSVGNSYRNLFGKYLDAEVKEVLLEEPYLYEKYQFQNFVSFLELLAKNCPYLKYVRLVTKTHSKAPENQINVIRQITQDLAKRNVTLCTKFVETLHDRKIVVSSGFIIKVGRGLHIFKPLNPFYSLGLCDYDFRRCLQTDVDIWRTKNFIC